MVIWSALIGLNLVSVIAEGTFFVPDLVPALPALVGQQAVAALVAALLIALLFTPTPAVPTVAPANQHHLLSWLGRFALAAVVYLGAYWVFGALNYALITGPYYETHAGGLVAPGWQVVISVEAIRAPLMVLSLVPLVLWAPFRRQQLMIVAGTLLFVVGGVVPLLWQVGALPPLLLAASAVEILCQNGLAGVATAFLLAPQRERVAPVARAIPAMP